MGCWNERVSTVKWGGFRCCDEVSGLHEAGRGGRASAGGGGWSGGLWISWPFFAYTFLSY